jgi:hypothetical protein
MSSPDDASFEMPESGAFWPDYRFFDPLALDQGTASRILDGLGQADVPPAYVSLAKVLAAASAPGRPEELEGEATVVAAFVGQRARTVELPAKNGELRPLDRRGLIVSRLVAQKVAAVAVAGGLALGGGLAAAATGSLPGAAQGVAFGALGFMGIDVPGPNSHRGGHPNARGRSGAPPTSTPVPPRSAKPGATTCDAPCGGQLPPGANGLPDTEGSGAPVATPGGTGTGNSASAGGTSAGHSRSDRIGGGASSAGSTSATSDPGSGTATGSSRRATKPGSGDGRSHSGTGTSDGSGGGSRNAGSGEGAHSGR